MLSPREIETYERDGLVIPAGFRLEDERLERLRGAVDEILARDPSTG